MNDGRKYKLEVRIVNVNDDAERFEEDIPHFTPDQLADILEDLHTDFGVWYCGLTGQRRSHE